jgi:hypothetical protein
MSPESGFVMQGSHLNNPLHTGVAHFFLPARASSEFIHPLSVRVKMSSKKEITLGSFFKINPKKASPMLEAPLATTGNRGKTNTTTGGYTNENHQD